MIQFISRQPYLYSMQAPPPMQNFKQFALNDLFDLLITKTTELIEGQERKIGGKEFQKLLLEIEQIQAAIKLKKLQSLN